MKGFTRADPRFSLCGLNCGLCPMNLDGHCPGCGGGAGNQSCKLARCSLEHGGLSYCFQCGEFPCGHYDGIDEYDSFITHQNRLADIERARSGGLERYHAEQAERRDILAFFLDRCNDGRRKTLCCLAANLLPLPALRKVRNEAEAMAELPLKERGSRVSAALLAAAGEGGSRKLGERPQKT